MQTTDTKPSLDTSQPDISELWQKSRLRITDKFAAPPVILRVDDSIIGTLGNFSASTGKASR